MDYHTQTLKGFVTDGEIMEKINRFTRRQLTADEVYAFPVILCDNEIDRDGECFSVEALTKLAKLFIGKTGIFDHDPKGENQNSRIFDAEVKFSEDRLTSYGEKYAFIQAGAYMMKTDKTASLIAEIDGGIKKEVSVSCSVEKEICSVCHTDRRKKACPHVKGKVYGGKTCHIILENPLDAYEFSFVAVPAQKNAGVTKSVDSPLSQLAEEVSKLYYRYDTVLSKQAIEEIVSKMSDDRLRKLKSELESRLAKRSAPQLVTTLGRSDLFPTDKAFDNSAFTLKP